MSKEKFQQIIDEVYGLIDVANPDPTYGSCHLEVQGSEFTLAYSEDDPDKLISFCEYGIPPIEQRAEIFARLLEANMLSYDSKSPHFAINPETGSVIFIMQIPLANLTAQQLINFLNMQSIGSNTWRLTYFLDEFEDALGRNPAEAEMNTVSVPT